MGGGSRKEVGGTLRNKEKKRGKRGEEGGLMREEGGEKREEG